MKFINLKTTVSEFLKIKREIQQTMISRKIKIYSEL